MCQNHSENKWKMIVDSAVWVSLITSFLTVLVYEIIKINPAYFPMVSTFSIVCFYIAVGMVCIHLLDILLDILIAGYVTLQVLIHPYWLLQKQ
jgi:hypothetical protein